MKEITIKTGTRTEILEYLRTKANKIITIVDEPCGGQRWSESLDKDEIYQLSTNTIEQQIDEYILRGSPIVGISLPCNGGERYRDTFIISDYSNIRTDMEIKRLDDPELRQQRIDAIKCVMEMELAAEERWERILKIVDDFRGQTISL